MRTRYLFLSAVLLFLCLSCGGCFLYLYNLGVKAQGRIVRVRAQDKQLQEAAKVAQKTLPLFLARLEHPKPGDKFAVKVRFKTSVGPEYLWLRDPKLQGSQYSGTLDQHPIAVRASKGDRLTFQRDEIYDYLIEQKDGSRAGGFTEIALGNGQP